MYTIYLVLFVFVTAEIAICFLSSKPKSGSSGFNHDLFFVLNVVNFFIVIVGLACGNAYLHQAIPTRVVAGEEAALVALDSKEGFAGTFVWGSGEIGSTAVLEVWVKNADGSVSPYRIPKTNEVHVFQEANLQNTGSWRNFYRVEDRNSALAKWLINFREPILERTELHVPRGTVKNDFKAN